MKLIIPMAGMGKRMRPHTLNTPKPLLLIAGKPIVQRIIEDLKNSSGKEIEEVHFIIGNFGNDTEKQLKDIASHIGAMGFIHYQDVPLGTAHAVYSAADGLEGEVIVAFADTLFEGNFHIDTSDEAIIWTMEVEDPSQYGVVVSDKFNIISKFVEKPKEYISNNAIIGIYYFRKGEILRDKLKNIIDNKILVNGEYQLTDALEAMINNNIKFVCKTIDKWLDCGNKSQFLKSSKQILKRDKNINFISGNTIINPVYIGKNVKILNSTIGPNVSIEDGAIISNSVISNSNVGIESFIDGSELDNSLVGSHCTLSNSKGQINIGDYNEIKIQ